MRYADEFRDPSKARALTAAIASLAMPLAAARGRPLQIMEVCGGHTHTIFRYGLKSLLPEEAIEFVHGPGCPVCVLPMGRVDDCLAIARNPQVIFTTFGDAMRVPGSQGSLLQAKAGGADVRAVYSPLDALQLARDNPGREVVFFALGFETTMPSTALTVLQARREQIRNFSLFCNHITIIPTIKAILDCPDLMLDGFLGPGHVSMVIGNRPYAFIAERYHKPIVVAGFEPLDLLQSLWMVIKQIAEGRREPIHPHRAGVRQRAGPGRGRGSVRTPRILRVARTRFDRSIWCAHARAVRGFRCRAQVQRTESQGRRSAILSVRRRAEGLAQAASVQGFRRRLHAGAAARRVDGVLRGRLRRVLPLRPDRSAGPGHDDWPDRNDRPGRDDGSA